MLLEGKNAVIYGGGGAIGGAVARAFAREGANVFLAGRTLARLETVAGEIRAADGVVEVARVDALDEKAVEEHADAMAERAGSIDVSFNLITHPSVHGTPMSEMAVEDYTMSAATAVRTTFLTARAASRRMMGQGSGVILFFGGSGDPIRDYYIGGTQVAFDAVESMRRQLAVELGAHGIRAVTIKTGGVPESLPEGLTGSEEIIEKHIVSPTMLGRAATLEDVGNVAAFVASDQARTMTAATVNVSCGALVD
jgi:3-oxoacyl-[acyl-carrier protein] reductase